jgi:ribosomal protein S16
LLLLLDRVLLFEQLLVPVLVPVLVLLVVGNYNPVAQLEQHQVFFQHLQVVRFVRARHRLLYPQCDQHDHEPAELLLLVVGNYNPAAQFEQHLELFQDRYYNPVDQHVHRLCSLERLLVQFVL